MDRMQAHRLFFAQLITAAVGVSQRDHPLVEAFAATPRERFLGPGPWHVFTPSGYIETPDDDPAFVYYDVTIALNREKQLNNGQPMLHAASLAALALTTGETVVHIGAGTGYYTALLARLVGHSGTVAAYEIDSELSQRAQANLASAANVSVYHASGTESALPACDVIYVNAAATGPLPGWLDALRPGGRLLFPLTPADAGGRPAPGMMLLITHEQDRSFGARFVMPVAFTPCIGARDPEIAARLTAAFARSDARNVRSLRRGGIPDSSSWCEGNGWWLSTQPAA